MSEKPHETPENTPGAPETTVQRGEHYPKRHGRNLVMLLAGAALLIGGAYGVQAVAQSKAYEHFRMGVGHASGWHDSGWHDSGWPGGWHGRGHKRLSEMSDEEIADRIQRIVRHMAIELDATEEQEDRMIALLTGLAADIRPLAERMQATRSELHGLLAATTIDRDALERLRAARLAEVDQISKTLVSAIADVAETLTPEQRAELAEMIRERRGMHGRHRRG